MKHTNVRSKKPKTNDKSTQELSNNLSSVKVSVNSYNNTKINTSCKNDVLRNNSCQSQSSDNDSPNEKSTMSMSASSELSISHPNSENESSDSIKTAISQSPIDPLEISRFPLRNPSEVNLNKIEEVRLVQKLLKEIKFIQSFDEDVLRGQKRYWLYTHNIVDETLRKRIKTALETHCLAHMQWITSCEFEINIDPDCKIEKVREYKKT